MFSKTVTFEDFDGETKTEIMYFNLTAPEIAKLEFEFDEGMEAYIRQAVEKKSNKKLFAMFELLIALAYGRRTEDGKTFVKRKEWLDELMCGPAYEELFLWLFTDPDNAAQFYNEIMPKKLEERLEKMGTTKNEDGSKPKSPRDFTREELVRMLQQKTAANEVATQ